MNTLYSQILGILKEGSLLPPQSAFTIGFSGGMDSSVLLHLLVSINREEHMGWIIKAAHFNHQMRETAGTDEDFCRKQAEKASIAFNSGTADVPAFCADKGISLETGARECRLSYFSSLQGPIVLAHHRNDQIETILHNIIRGTGLRGLSGMKEMVKIGGQTIIRPLLGCGRPQVEEYAAEESVPFVQDPSNFDLAFTRNRLRHEVIPILRSFNPGFEEHLVAVAASSASAWGLLSADPGLRSCIRLERSDMIELDTSRLRELPLSLQSIVLFQALEKLGTDLSRRAVDKALGLVSRPVQGTVCAELAGGGQVRREYDRLILLKAAPSGSPPVRGGLPVPGEYRGPGVNEKLTAEVLEATPELFQAIQCNAHPMTAYLDRDLVPGDMLVARTREPGDRFHPLGAPGERKLQDFLVDVKCPLGDRDRILLVASEAGIAWVVGYRSSERCKVTAGTSRILKLMLKPV